MNDKANIPKGFAGRSAQSGGAHGDFDRPFLDTSCIPVEFGGGFDAKDALQSNAADEDMKPPEPYTYTPSNPLIDCVSVRPRLSPARFYADFLSDAKRFLNAPSKECECVPFPAYIPEYRSMKRAQLEFYLYFRDSVKKGIKRECPQSYIMLLLFEIINLPGEIRPECGVKLMCALWLMYREEYPRLDAYIADWLCDYCLIHRLDLPEETKPYLNMLASLSGFEEFYLNPLTAEKYDIITRAAGYEPDSAGKYPETRRLLREHLPGIIDRISIARSGEPFGAQKILPAATGARCAYRSALCAYNNNALISYTVHSFSKSGALRSRLASVIKYCENKTRAHLSIRARLKSVFPSPSECEIIDRYFEENLPAEKKAYRSCSAVSKTESSRFDALYEPESRGLSYEAAKEIESRSWDAAFMLEEAFECGTPGEIGSGGGEKRLSETGALRAAAHDEAAEDKKPEHAKTPEGTAAGRERRTDPDSVAGTACGPTVYPPANPDSSAVHFTETERVFLSLIYSGRQEQAKKYAAEQGMMSDAVAEGINTRAFDAMGDSVLEYDGENYTVIPEYIEEVEKWIQI